MEKYTKILIGVEILIAFAVPVLLLALLSFMVLSGVVESPSKISSSLGLAILWCVAGMLGVYGVVRLWLRLVYEKLQNYSKARLWFYIVSGCAALSPLVYMSAEEPNFFLVIFFAPYIVTAHLVVLNSDLLLAPQ